MNRRWQAVSRLTNRAAVRLGPLVRLGGRVQARLLLATRGRLGRRFFGAEVFVLEVVGRKSGLVRSTPLLYVADGDRWAVLAANAGSPAVPAWWLNLRAAGGGTAIFGGTRRVAVTAREATEDERPALLEKLAANYPPVAHYSGYTDRDIPVVILEPA